jgi:hypothetical protein
VDGRVVSSDVVHMHTTSLDRSLNQKALGMLPEDGYVVPKLVGATIHN